MTLVVLLFAITLLLGFVLNEIMGYYQLDERYSLSSPLIVLAPFGALAGVILILSFGGVEGELVGSSSTLSEYIGSFAGSFLLSLFVVLLYKVRASYFYLFTSTILNGLTPPAMVFLFSIINLREIGIPGGYVLLLIPLLWSLIFCGYTFYFLKVGGRQVAG